jgi:hypothetical protein
MAAVQARGGGGADVGQGTRRVSCPVGRAELGKARGPDAASIHQSRASAPERALFDMQRTPMLARSQEAALLKRWQLMTRPGRNQWPGGTAACRTAAKWPTAKRDEQAPMKQWNTQLASGVSRRAMPAARDDATNGRLRGALFVRRRSSAAAASRLCRTMIELRQWGESANECRTAFHLRSSRRRSSSRCLAFALCQLTTTATANRSSHEC